MLGVFCALDVFLFYVFWEVMLVPMYFLIGIWGGAARLYARSSSSLHLVGSVVMLLGILASTSTRGKLEGFEVDGHLRHHPVVPHGHPGRAAVLGVSRPSSWASPSRSDVSRSTPWLPDAHVEAPTAGSVILAGVLLKMGTYGFIRFSLPLFPDALGGVMNLGVWHPTILDFMVTLSIIGIVYAALVTLVQKDMKKLIAYSSVSHLGFCMLGMFALNPLGIEGSVLQMINHGLSTGGLFLVVGLIYERRHTKEIAQFGGLAHVMPDLRDLHPRHLPGLDGPALLNGFIGEFLILQGAYSANRAWAYWAVSGVVLGRRTCSGSTSGSSGERSPTRRTAT
jgi:NADH-quinone oxidoreductase subunit M